MAAIEAEFDQLLAFPLSGPARTDLAADLRVKFHRAYAIYYTPAPRELIIIRVLHGAHDADADAIAGGGGFGA